MKITCISTEDGRPRTADLPVVLSHYLAAMELVKTEGVEREVVRAALPELSEAEFAFFYDGTPGPGVKVVPDRFLLRNPSGVE